MAPLNLSNTKARTIDLWSVLTILLVVACVGSYVFWSLERVAELQRYEYNRALYTSLTESVDFEHCHIPEFRDVGFCRRHRELEDRLEEFFHHGGNSIEDQELWTRTGSFFFVINLGSTVGYANQGAPHTPSGRLAAIIFGIITIPLFGCAFILASKYMVQAAEVVFQPFIGPGGSPELERSRMFRLTVILIVLLWPGAAMVFKLLEGWSFARSLFFCFVTFTMVGLGDDVPSTLVGRAVCILYTYTTLGLSVGILRKLSIEGTEETPLFNTRAAQYLRKPWVCLLGVAILCLCGALFFPHLEREEELRRYERNRRMYNDLYNLAHFSGCDKEFVRNLDFCKNADSFRKGLKPFFGPDTPNSMVDRQIWTEAGSSLFVLSLSSTVGYGAHNPHTRAGKIATVIFGLVAFPLFLQYVVASAEIGKHLMGQLIHKIRHKLGLREDPEQSSTWGLVILVLMIWIGGSLIFMALEAEHNWDFFKALYFCFVTLSCIGFSNVMPRSDAAKVFTFVYIVIGLGSVGALLSQLVDQFHALTVNDAPDNTDKNIDEDIEHVKSGTAY